jgi:hypothetical protein
MTIADERVELFTYLAQLFIYLTGGKSHVGYLHNYLENPIHQLVLVLPTLSNIRETSKVDNALLPPEIKYSESELITGDK